MELNSGPKIANSTCGKTIDVETIDRDSTVYIYPKLLRTGLGVWWFIQT